MEINLVFHQSLIDTYLIIDGFNFHITIEDELLIFMMDSETNDTDELKSNILTRIKTKKMTDLNINF